MSYKLQRTKKKGAQHAAIIRSDQTNKGPDLQTALDEIIFNHKISCCFYYALLHYRLERKIKKNFNNICW